MLQYHFNWKTLSAIAGVTWWNFYFRLFPGTIRSPQVVAFLRHLLRHLPGKVLVIWDGLRAHRSRMVQTFVDTQRGRLQLECLPAYAPELNPDELVWNHMKRALANSLPKDTKALHRQLRKPLRRLRRSQRLLRSCVNASELPWTL